MDLKHSEKHLYEKLLDKLTHSHKEKEIVNDDPPPPLPIKKPFYENTIFWATIIAVAIPIINKIFTETFGIEKINQSDAFTSVAHGLGVYSTMI